MRRAPGYTTVELLVTVAILAILVAVAAPALGSFVVNTRIRSLGESMASALTKARADAVRLNTRVAFTFNGTNWTVTRVDTARQLQAGTGRESVQPGLTLTVTPTGAGIVTYDALGRRMTQNADGSAPMAQLDITATNPPSSSAYHPLRIQVLASGLSRLCDPSYPATNPKACL